MKYTFLLLLTLTALLSSSEFRGAGFGETAKEAKYAALSDLSQSIKAEVSSKFIHYKQATKEKLDSRFDGSIQVSSNLPIIGAEFELYDHPDSIEALVKLSPLKAKALYVQKLSTLYDEITTLEKRSRKAKNSVEKEKILTLLLERLDEYDRYRSVAIAIGVENSKNPTVNKAEVQSDLLKLQSDIDSMEKASSVLAKPFKNYNNIYIYPPKNTKSHEITPFAKAVQMHLASRLSTVSQPAKASFLMMGEYMTGKSGIVLSYRLADTATLDSITAKTITLAKKSYAGYRAEPKSGNFDMLLHEGVVLSSDLRVLVNTNKGSDDLLFAGEEEIELLIKLNKMGYFYIVGYTQTDKNKLSYLLELNDAPGDAAFIQFVNADDINRWISLGTFTVEPPFGIESIQVIASNKKITALPPHHYDKKSGYYIIDKNLEKGLSKTRGLIKKRSGKREVAEAVLMFTTMEK